MKHFLQHKKPQSTLLSLCYEYSGDNINLEEKDWIEAKHLVNIFDVYAIDFAEWLFDVSRIGTTKELLEIYKKEKGL